MKTNNAETTPIFMDSEDSAKFAENISGWVDRNGFFFGNDEQAARYSGATHIHCIKCGNAHTKNSYCHPCHEKKLYDKYANARRQSWDGKTPLYSEKQDKFYFDENDLISSAYDFAEENGHIFNESFDPAIVYDKLRLYLCQPAKLSHVEQDYWCDDLAADQDLPDEVLDALEELNKAIDKANGESPCAWEPSDIVAVIFCSRLCANKKCSRNINYNVAEYARRLSMIIDMNDFKTDDCGYLPLSKRNKIKEIK